MGGEHEKGMDSPLSLSCPRDAHLPLTVSVPRSSHLSTQGRKLGVTGCIEPGPGLLAVGSGALQVQWEEKGVSCGVLAVSGSSHILIQRWLCTPKDTLFIHLDIQPYT